MLTQVADGWPLECCRGRAAWAARGWLVDLESAWGFGSKSKGGCWVAASVPGGTDAMRGPAVAGFGAAPGSAARAPKRKVTVAADIRLRPTMARPPPGGGGEVARAGSNKWLRARVASTTTASTQ